MRIEIAYMVAVALCWGGWPLVARSAGSGGPGASLLLSLFSLIPIGLLALATGDLPRAGGAELGKLAVAGVLMGFGLVAFTLVAGSDIDASVSVPTMDAAMLAVTAAGAIYFFGESLTPQKVVGLGLLLSGIALLRPT